MSGFDLYRVTARLPSDAEVAVLTECGWERGVDECHASLAVVVPEGTPRAEAIAAAATTAEELAHGHGVRELQLVSVEMWEWVVMPSQYEEGMKRHRRTVPPMKIVQPTLPPPERLWGPVGAEEEDR